jgi:two-component system chemotaxis sensor kinase CheA
VPDAQAVRSSESPVPETEGRPSTQDSKSEKKPAAGAVKVDTAKLDYLVDMVGEMVIADSMLRQVKLRTCSLTVQPSEPRTAS